ncbi:MAG TPA: AAA family ATPase [Patescibacteria group bacterium]|nr:AAA family ATPase [Patescibacteria group bacterium]
MIIIGITGTLGAGKQTIVDYLVKSRGFKHFSVREYLVKRLKREGRAINRDTMVELANRLRKQNGPSFLAEELLKEAKKTDKNCVIESIRTEGEIKALRKIGGFFLLAVDAKQEERYKRILARDGETDHVDFNRFLLDEVREMTSRDPNKQNLRRCMELADYTIINNGTVEDLEKGVLKIIHEIEKGSKERKG